MVFRDKKKDVSLNCGEKLVGVLVIKVADPSNIKATEILAIFMLIQATISEV